jgi:membrane protein YqaA with SNARE-associated domain
MYRILFKKNRIYDISDHKYASWILFILAIGDSSFLPTPITTLFLILISVNPQKSSEYIIKLTAGLAIGGTIAYLTGKMLWFDTNGNFTEFALFVLGNIPGFTENSYQSIQFLYTKWNFWFIFFASFTPIPFGLFSFTSGAFHINYLIFILSTLAGNGIKLFTISVIFMKIAKKLRRLTLFKI